MTELYNLSDKNTSPERIAAEALKDDGKLQALLDGISPEAKEMQIRENSYKALMILCAGHPQTLLPHWGYFVDLLRSDNGSSKYAAIHIIATLVQAGDEGRFEKDFDVYYSLLDDESVMVASHAAGASGKIARAKPHLQSNITRRFLDIDRSHFDESRKSLIKSYIIQAFGEYFKAAQDKAGIIAFVKRQLDCSSPKTRKMAREFLKKWGEAA